MCFLRRFCAFRRACDRKPARRTNVAALLGRAATAGAKVPAVRLRQRGDGRIRRVREREDRSSFGQAIGTRGTAKRPGITGTSNLPEALSKVRRERGHRQQKLKRRSFFGRGGAIVPLGPNACEAQPSCRRHPALTSVFTTGIDNKTKDEPLFVPYKNRFVCTVCSRLLGGGCSCSCSGCCYRWP